MDAKLAEIYGTNAVTESDVEKLAAAELAEGLAGEEGLDLSGLGADEIEALAREVLGAGEATEEKVAEADEEITEEQTDDEVDPEFQEKVAEADYLGRVMAHSFNQERVEIEKNAGPKMEAAKAALKRFGGRAKAFGGKAKDKAKAVGAKAKSVGKKGAEGVREGARRVGAAAAITAGQASKYKKPLAIGAAGGAAAGFAAGRMSKKSSDLSALDQLAIARAQEILEQNGVEMNTEKVAADEDNRAELLAQAVEARAEELLTEAGYSFEDETEESAE